MSPSAIEWTDETWNPTVGCSRVSPGCDHCYAIGVAHRAMQPAHVGLTYFNDSGEARWGADWTGEVRLLPDRLDTPLHWRRPRRVFVDSMSDLFHQDVPDTFIARVFGVMADAHQHTYQVLTKRPQRMASLLASERWYEPLLSARRSPYRAEPARGAPLPHVWLGTSVEDQRYADLRIPHLLKTPAAVRFLSIEPLLGPVNLCRCDGAAYGAQRHPFIVHDGCPLHGSVRVGWVIVGGESGPGARPMHPDWVRSIRDQCTAAGVPFFFKQWGEWAPFPHPEFGGGRVWPVDPCPVACHVGKKAAGRELDGRTWDEMPRSGGSAG